jgi:hypothetical protein
VSRFDEVEEELERRIASLPRPARALALLSLAQRYLAVFELFEKQLDLTGTLRRYLDVLWAGAGEDAAADVAAKFERLVPDEETPVGGFHGALAQYIGNVAYAAAIGFAGGEYEPGCARGGLEALRVLLSEATLGCLDPGDNPTGRAFEASLHQHEVVVNELREINALIDAVATGATVAQMKSLASHAPFDVATLEPELSRGLERDRAETEAWLSTIRRT